MTIAKRQDSVINVLPRLGPNRQNHFRVRTRRRIEHASHPESGNGVLIENPGLGGGTASLSHRLEAYAIRLEIRSAAGKCYSALPYVETPPSLA